MNKNIFTGLIIISAIPCLFVLCIMLFAGFKWVPVLMSENVKEQCISAEGQREFAEWKARQDADGHTENCEDDAA